MKRLTGAFVMTAALMACQESESVTSDFTGNEAVYALQQASDLDVSGTVTFKEKRDGTADVLVVLNGTEGNAEHPVHLHLGNIAEPAADVAALLNPVIGSTGNSETSLVRLADESAITYTQLLDLNACIKVHLGASGPDRDIILAGGNIGLSSKADPSGRSGIGVCKSN